MYRYAVILFACAVLGGCTPGEVKSDPILTQPLMDIYSAAAAGDFEATSQFIAAGEWDYNTPNAEGLMPLHSAVQGGNADIVTVMVQNGADVMNPDMEGRTPLQYAQELGKDDIVAVLQQLGATR